MARIKLNPLLSYAQTFSVTVRTTDLNYAGHLGNDRVLSLIHEARMHFLAAYGWDEMDCAGVSLIMAGTTVVYKAQGHAGDKLRIETTAIEPWRGGFRLCHRLTRPADETVVGLVETDMVCFDYRTGKVPRLPGQTTEFPH